MPHIIFHEEKKTPYWTKVKMRRNIKIKMITRVPRFIDMNPSLSISTGYGNRGSEQQKDRNKQAKKKVILTQNTARNLRNN